MYKLKNFPLSDKINKDNYFKYRYEAFEIISDTLDLMLKEMAQKNPTFLIKDYDKLIDIKDVELGDKVYTIPIENNKPLKVV